MTESTSHSSPASASACPHPEAVGTRWGDPVSESRKAQLEARLEAWANEADHGDRKGPFSTRIDIGQSEETLTGADVYYLAQKAHAAKLRDFDIVAKSPGMLLVVDMEHLPLEQADLRGAHLEGARLDAAHLDEAALDLAHLEGADLSSAGLGQADLRGIFLDSATDLGGVRLTDSAGTALIADARWGGANLAVVKWSGVTKLGDEQLSERNRWKQSRQAQAERLLSGLIGNWLSHCVVKV